MMAKVSDGFLFDYNSNLIGMVVERYSKDSENTISALALYDIYDIIESILNDTFVGYVGIKGESLDYEIRKYVGNDIPAGVYVVAVENNSPAYQCGIMAGDIITKINHMDVDDMEDIEDMVGGCRQGTVLQITLERNTASVRAADERLDALLGHRGAATVSLLFALSDGAKRFGVLRSQMGRMSQKTLVAELRALEQLGAVERIVFAEIPPRVEYSLTAAGEELVPLLRAVETWCARRTGRVE